MLTTVITAALAIAVVALGAIEIWAFTQERFGLSARLLGAELVAAAGLLGISAADRDWWLAALWAGCLALTAYNLRRTNRKRQVHTA